MSYNQKPENEAVFKHILKPLEKKDINYDNKIMYGFDIETYTRENKFLFASLINDEGRHNFYNEEDLFNFLMLPKNYNCDVIATNLQFDFFGSFMYKFHEHIKPMIRNGRLICAKLIQYKDKTHSKCATFYDTMQLNMASVKNLGKSIKIKKLDYPPNFIMSELTEEEKLLKLDPKVKLVNYPKDKEEWKLLEDYCHNDAFISYKWFKSVYLPDCIEQGVKPSFTSASHSLKVFRTNYLNDEINIDATFHYMIRLAYYGGRTECVKRGKAYNVTCGDFNSLYPSCMLEEMPDPNSEYYKKICSMRDIENYEGLTYVEGFQDDRYITVLPYKIEVQGTKKLIFPCGYLKGYWINLELRKAIKNGFTITKFGDGIIYTKTKKYFYTFINDCYTRRSNFKNECQLCKKINKIKDAKKCLCGGDLGNPQESTEKLKMNSNYGKYAQVYEESTTLIPSHAVTFKDLENATTSIKHEGSGHEWIEIKNSNSEPNDYSVPIWSAQITAIARCKLFDVISQRQVQEHLSYMDTDSVFLKDNFMVPTSDKLGEIKLEYKCDECIFVKPKFYTAKNPKIKGVNSIRTKNQFLEVLKSHKVVEDSFIRFTTAIKSKPNHKLFGVKVNQIISKDKTIDLEDSKRDWLGKKFNQNELQDSKPLYINQKQEVCIRKGRSYIPMPKRKMLDSETLFC